jgi:CRISPR-associated protein (Cas_Cas5)
MSTKTISFRLWGEVGMWKHPSEVLGHFSAAGPSPSQIGGILGAAKGCKYPEKTKGLYRPVSPELLDWLEKNQVEVACRLLTRLSRISNNVNATKNIREGYSQSFRLQRKSLESPEYEILVKLKAEAADELIEALKRPHFPIYLGDSNHPGKILFPKIVEGTPEKGNWAFHSMDLLQEEYQWNTRFGLGDNRLIREGYWNYPAQKTTADPDFQKTVAA